LPAFEPGDKVKLDLKLQGNLGEATTTATKVETNGKVKLEL
jgi:hypothetical protein